MNQDKGWHTTPYLWEKLKPLAHKNRNEPTQAEKELWKHLRMNRLHGLSFRRQHCLGQFIVDFYCSKVKLAIEVDGDIHQYREEEDKLRQTYLESHGIKVLRFSNDMILNNIDRVISKIELCLPGTL